MEILPQAITLIGLGATLVALVSICIRFDGLVQIKLGLDGGQVTIDGRRGKGEAPPSLGDESMKK